MNKQELIDNISKETGLPKDKVKLIIESLTSKVKSTLNEGGRVSLVGFGSWSISKRAAREGRNPQTGKPIKIAEKKVVKFRPSDDLISQGTGDGGPRVKE